MLSRRVDFGPAKPVTRRPAADPSSRKLNCGVKCRPPDGTGMAAELGLAKHARQPQGEVGNQKHENDWNHRLRPLFAYLAVCHIGELGRRGVAAPARHSSHPSDWRPATWYFAPLSPTLVGSLGRKMCWKRIGGGSVPRQGNRQQPVRPPERVPGGNERAG